MIYPKNDSSFGLRWAEWGPILTQGRDRGVAIPRSALAAHKPHATSEHAGVVRVRRCLLRIYMPAIDRSLSDCRYNAYTDENGEPAGDYLGTLSQMDHQIGRLRGMLKSKGVADNTALWFTADNGPHTAGGGGCTGKYGRSSNQATNGLRQCKASLFEGGIREPGILEWPAMIKTHRCVLRIENKSLMLLLY